MRKQIIKYTSSLDALIALTKQLNTYEIKYQMNSEEFFAKYSQGETSDDEVFDEVFVEWAGNYQHYLALHQDIKSKLRDVA
ncbi:antitoxin TumA [Nostoc sp.]|uniref:antitoxin TumA n=1 Tax=Nostoc sp. TaxID=1180 RepID=UPI002FFBBC9A